MTIKLILLAALAAAAYLLVHGRTSAFSLLVRRAITLLGVGVGALAVLFPDTVTEVARLVGVGRGTDLVVYLLCVAFLFTTIGLHLRMATLHDQVVELTRLLALHDAEHQGSSSRSSPRPP